jgi:Zn-dependent protease with chaperone function
MIWLAAVPLSVGLALLGLADRLATRLKPGLALRLLTALALSVALCTGLVLSVLALLACAQLGPLSHLGGWSAPALRAGIGFPIAAGFIALVVVAVCLAAAMVRVVRTIQVLVQAHRSVQQMRPTVGDLVLIEDETPVAYSVAGLRGRIVVSSAMLSILDADERGALLAHEASHLRHRHQFYVLVVDVASAANPLLRPVSRAVRRATERWADEDAAAATGDRAVVARAIAKAAIATTRRPALAMGLGMATDHAVERVQRMLLPAPSTQRLLPAVAVGVGLTTWVTSIVFAEWANELVQVAESVYSRR